MTAEFGPALPDGLLERMVDAAADALFQANELWPSFSRGELAQSLGGPREARLRTARVAVEAAAAVLAGGDGYLDRAVLDALSAPGGVTEVRRRPSGYVRIVEVPMSGLADAYDPDAIEEERDEFGAALAAQGSVPAIEEARDDRLLAIARAYCLVRYTYPPAAGYVSQDARDQHIDNDARSTMGEKWWRVLAPLLIAEGGRRMEESLMRRYVPDEIYHAGVAEGRRQAAEAVRNGWAVAPASVPLGADLVPTLVEYCAQLAACDADHMETDEPEVTDHG